MKKITYNDKMGSRDRSSTLIIFTRNQVWFGTNSIPGVATVIPVGYNKNGKWSSTDWEITLADGVDATTVRQDWDTGKYFPDTCMSWASVGKSLGLDGVSPSAVEAAVRSRLARHAERFDARVAALRELEEAGIQTNTVEWRRGFNTNRIGNDVLLVDGEFFAGETIPGKVLVLSRADGGGGGRYSSTRYLLEVADGVELEFLTEGGFPGDDSLEERGWKFDGERWVAPNPESFTMIASEDGTPQVGSGNPLSEIFKGIKL